ncbi:MAG: serine kinase [Candidatus Magasanikbacteria bacterium]|nr:serine kinase [Candidatus Magasanikbacteria bacterium]
MEKVYLLQHSYTQTNLSCDCSDDERVKVIGIYSSRAEAKDAAKRAGKLPGFKKYPAIIDYSSTTDENEDGFYIDEIKINKDSWTDGFSS